MGMKNSFCRLRWMGIIVALQTAITAFGADSSNVVFAVTNTATTNSSSQPSIARTTPGLVESNGMYSIDIQMEPPEEVIPAGTCSMPLDMKQVLAIYTELTGAKLKVAELSLIH